MYLALGRDRGKFLHLPSDGEPRVIDLPNAYSDLPLGTRPVLLKVHGGVDPDGRLRESFVVSEDDYIGYLSPGGRWRRPAGHARREAPPQPFPLPRLRRARLEPARLPPPRLRRGEPRLPVVGRAAGAERSRERDFWRHRGIDLFDAPLGPYLDRLVDRLAARDGAGWSRDARRHSRRGCVDGPWKGLAPYDDSDTDAQLFFGRGREIEVACANLTASRLTVLFGATGVGKSSLLRAGVMRRLRRDRAGRAPRRSCRPGRATRSRQSRPPCALRSSGARTTVWSDRAPGRARSGRGRTSSAVDLYLVLDQLEEYFLYHAGENGPGSFVGRVPGARHRPRRCRVNVLLGIREDALGRLDALRAAVPGVLSNYLRLEQLDRDAGADGDPRAARALERALRRRPDDGRARARRGGARRGRRRPDRAGPGGVGGVTPLGARRADRGAVPPARARAAVGGGARKGSSVLRRETLRRSAAPRASSRSTSSVPWRARPGWRDAAAASSSTSLRRRGRRSHTPLTTSRAMPGSTVAERLSLLQSSSEHGSCAPPMPTASRSTTTFWRRRWRDGVAATRRAGRLSSSAADIGASSRGSWRPSSRSSSSQGLRSMRSHSAAKRTGRRVRQGRAPS